MISFIITVYNKEKYLNEVLLAIRAQCLPVECEYIIIDDGSTDSSFKKIRETTDSWDNCRIISQKNAGVVKATIAGIEATAGEYIKFVDGDDKLAPNLVLEQYSLLKKHPNLSFVSCSYGTQNGFEITPRFATQKCLSETNLLASEIEIFSGDAALLHVLARDQSPIEALTGMSGGLSRRDSINLPMVRSLTNKYQLRHLQDHLISACSLSASSGFAFIHRIGFSELSKSTPTEKNNCLSGQLNYSKTLREQALINLLFLEKLPPEAQLRLLRATTKLLLKANYGKIGLKIKSNPIHPYNKTKRTIKSGDLKQLRLLQENLLHDLTRKLSPEKEN